MPESILLRVPEVALRLGLGRSTIYGLIASGELMSVRVGRARRVPAASVDAWVRQRVEDVERTNLTSQRPGWSKT